MKGNLDSVILKIFACEIQNPGLWNPEYSLKNPTLQTEALSSRLI